MTCISRFRGLPWLVLTGCALLTPLDDLRGTPSNDAGADGGNDGGDGGGNGGDGGVPSFVQGKALSDPSGPHTNWTSTLVLPSAVAPHDALVVGVVAFQSNSPISAITVSDNNGDTFTSSDIVRYGGWPNGIIATAFDVVGGDTTLTIQVTGVVNVGVQGDDVIALEYHNVSALDAWVGQGGNNTSTDAMTSGSAMTTSTNDMIVGFGYTPGTASSGTGFTQRFTAAGSQVIAEDRLAPSIGSQGATATAAGTNWIMMMAALRP